MVFLSLGSQGSGGSKGYLWVNPLELNVAGGIHAGIFLGRSSKAKVLVTVVGPGTQA